MSILTQTLPTTIEVGGRVFLINSDFKTMLKIQELLLSTESDEGKTKKALFWFYGEQQHILQNVEEATEKFVWFYFCGKPPDKKSRRVTSGEAAETQRPCYSYEHDAALIYAAFMQQYGIDLVDTDLHWWKFRALFEALNEDTLFYEVRKCRAVKINSKLSSGQQEYYREMKKRYALPLPENEQEYQNALAEALMNGGDVSKVLENYKEGGE